MFRPASSQREDHVVYALACASGRFYVGRCLARRLQERLRSQKRGLPMTRWTCGVTASRASEVEPGAP
jgi:predicted GIY-YIG superfamily endonuclease